MGIAVIIRIKQNLSKLFYRIILIIITSCDADTVCPDPDDICELFHINRVASATRALIYLVTLTFNL